MEEKLQETIERLVDKNGVLAVTDALIETCYAKAEHIRQSYQDEPLAKQWDAYGTSLANPINPVQAPS